MVERDLPYSQQFSAVNLFASQAASLEEIELCLEMAAEAKKGFFSEPCMHSSY